MMLKITVGVKVCNIGSKLDTAPSLEALNNSLLTVLIVKQHGQRYKIPHFTDHS